ncbi:MAG: extracellular solute-binding protein [Candidatus Shapirobacteria bacterium]
MDYQDIQSPLPPRQSDDGATPKTTAPTTGFASTTIPVAKNTPPFVIILSIIGVIIVLIFVIIKFLLPVLQGKSTTVVTLNYWGLWEDKSIISGIISDFEAKNPNIKINYKTQQKNDYRSRLSGRLTKDPDTEEVPDIFRIHSSWLPMFTGMLAPVPEASSKTIGLDTDFYPVFKNDLKLSGKYQAVPLMYDGLSLFYNQDLLEKSQAVLPKTWWDLQTTASKLTVRDENGRLKIAGVAMGLTDNVDHWNDILGILLKQNGADLLVTTQDNNDKIRDVISYYANFKTQYKTWDETMPPSTQAFAEGKLVFYFAPSWRIFNIEEMNPTLKFAITTIPQLATLQDQSGNSATSTANLTNIHWATYWAEAVNSRSKHQKEAWKFIEFLSSAESMEKMYTAASQTRSFGEIYPRISLASKLATNPKIKPFLSVATNAESGYLSSRTWDAGLNTELSKYFSDAVNSIALKASDPKDIVTDLRSGIDQIIQKYKLK